MFHPISYILGFGVSEPSPLGILPDLGRPPTLVPPPLGDNTGFV